MPRKTVLTALPLTVLAMAVAACSSASGGPVEGPTDAHCGSTVQTVDAAVCSAQGEAPHEHEHETLYNAEGDDDDCKYHVAWSATDIAVDEDVTLTVKLTSKADGKPVTGAAPDIEAFLSTTHGAVNEGAKTTETEAGTYTIGPIRFDASGKWTVRFHFFDDCTEVDEASPHSHVAFYVDVP